MSKVFVLDTMHRALDPVRPGYARTLLSSGKAAVFRRSPFTIILKKEVPEPITPPLRLKIDPGSKTTGLAVVNDASGEVVFAAELQHRGHTIKKALDVRRAVRRNRRQRQTRYRQPRFKNRKRSKGWLPPSLESRIANVLTWAQRLMRLCPIAAISQEVVKFDLQKQDHPEIAGVQYQQGELFGYEVREYLLEKWGRHCAYCNAKDVPLQVEHITPRARGGSNRVGNLTLACEPCNMKKGTQAITTFLANKPDVLKRVLAQAKAPLKDAAAVNTTRLALYDRLKAFGLPIECGSGGLTKYNRTTRGLAKTHWCDAACVGKSTPDVLCVKAVVPLLIMATGHGSRQMCRMNKHGFPRTGPKQAKSVKGFQTGDMVRAVVATGKKQGTYVGRVAVRTRGIFNITTAQGVVADIPARFCVLIAHSDGYKYSQRKEAALPPSA
ncbi:MAG: HNH endonuclease [Ktedonobacteraceae bacterium]|nr:HNH endonuclease [Ktedonobacteraceae bacterium]